MNFRERFSAVLFDLDGVLTDTAHYHFLAWKALARDLGLALEPEFNEKLKGIDRLNSLRLICEHGGITLTETELVAQATRKNQHYLELIAAMGPDDLLPGARDRLEELRRLEIKIGLASASRNAPQVLQALGIEDLIDAIADPSAVQQGKPAPDIFLLAAAMLGVAPERCLGVEDAAAGVTAIHAAGMLALGIGDPRHLAEADRVVPGLDSFCFADLQMDARSLTRSPESCKRGQAVQHA